MSTLLRERAEAAVGRSNDIFSEAAAAPFLPHGQHAHIPEVLSSVTLSNIAESVQRLNSRVAKVENMVMGLESMIVKGMNRQAIVASGPGTSATGYGGLFQMNSVSDMHEALHDALGPVRDTLRQHEKLIADVVTAMNSLDAWKVAASAASLTRSHGSVKKESQRSGSEQRSPKEEDVQSTSSKRSAQSRQAKGRGGMGSDSTATFIDAEARLKRLKNLAASISELPSIPLVPPSHYAGHGKQQQPQQSDVNERSIASSTSTKDPAHSNMKHNRNVTLNTTGSVGFGNMGDAESDTNTTMTSDDEDGSDRHHRYNAVHEMSDTTTQEGGGFRTLVEVTDASITESDAERRNPNLMNRVQRILGGEASAGDITGDEHGLLAGDTSSNSEAYRELIGRLQLGHHGYSDSTPVMTTTSSE